MNTLRSLHVPFEGREMIFNAFTSAIFPLLAAEGTSLKILIPKQILQRLVIALAYVEVGNASGNLQNEIRQTIYCFIKEKNTKKVYTNI